MKQLDQRVSEKTKAFSDYLTRYIRSNRLKWEFDPMIQLSDTRKVSLFDPGLNGILSSYYSVYPTRFYSFYTNHYNPTEKTLLVTFFEILEETSYKGNSIYLVRFFNKPRVLSKHAMFSINRDSDYIPSLYRNLVLIDRNIVDHKPTAWQWAKVNVDCKRFLMKYIARIALVFFWEKLAELEGLTVLYISGLFNFELRNSIKEVNDMHSLPHICQTMDQNGKTGYDSEELFNYLHERFMALNIRFRYKFTGLKVDVEKKKRNLILTPAVNELYLRISQEYFMDAEWPFISGRLLSHIRESNEGTVSGVAATIGHQVSV